MNSILFDLYPISSSSSLFAHSKGLSAGSNLPAGSSMNSEPTAYLNCLIKAIFPSGSTGIITEAPG